MGYKEQILKILNGNKLTVKKLAEKLNISESDIRVYIKRIKDNNINELEVVGTEDKYKVYTLNKREQESNDLYKSILRKILPQFVELEVYLEDTTEQEDKKIEELIKECL